MPDVPSSPAGALFGPNGPDTSLGNKALQPVKPKGKPEAEPEGSAAAQIEEVLASVKGLGVKVRDQLKAALMDRFGDILGQATAAAPPVKPVTPVKPGPAGPPPDTQTVGIRG
jgi:hypothetical protein